MPGKAGRLVAGFRGAPPADAAALADVLHRLSQLADDFPELAELDLNPVIGLPDRAVVVDARIRVARPQRPHRREELVAIAETAFLPEQVRELRDRGLPVIALGSIVAGAALWLAGQERWADIAWAAGAVVVLVPLVLATARSLRRGDVGVDAIALVAIVWALALGQFLAAAIVALMMSGGAALEAWAAGRARRELRLLVERAPRVAHRYVDGSLSWRSRSTSSCPATSSRFARARWSRPTASSPQTRRSWTSRR